MRSFIIAEPSHQSGRRPSLSRRSAGRVSGVAMGTALSRATGFVRTSLLIAALGAELHADLFTIANTLPNLLYILVAGGVFNAVLVPQLVQAMARDDDGGVAYANRVLTLAVIFLAAMTLTLVLAAPAVLRIVVDGSILDPSLAAQWQSIVDLARYCLPQVFFYGMFVVVGQILNSRGRFAPMAWAPIANNVLAIAVLFGYLAVFGPAGAAQATAAYTGGQEVLLGLGSTLGIIVQFLILAAYLRGGGFEFRPRFDFRHGSLRNTLTLGGWTVAFVLLNQVAYAVIMRLASASSAEAAASGAGAAGFTVYSSALLLIMTPHAIITASVATVTLPRLAALAHEKRSSELGRQVRIMIERALSLILPACAFFAVAAPTLTEFAWGYAAGRASLVPLTQTLTLFVPGLVFFTVHYLTLRGLFALERHRTVTWIQGLIAVANVGAAVTLAARARPENVAPLLALAYSSAYLVGSACSLLVLNRLVGGLTLRKFAPRLPRIALRSGAVALGALAARALIDANWSPQVGVLAQARVGAEIMMMLLLGAALAYGVDRLSSAPRLRRQG